MDDDAAFPWYFKLLVVLLLVEEAFNVLNEAILEDLFKDDIVPFGFLDALP